MPNIFIQLIITFLTGLFGTNLDNQSAKDYALYRVTQPSQVGLIANFEEKKSVEELVKENGCAAGINGGFYGEDNKPLGWFVSDSKQLQKVKASSLFNGFVWQDTSGRIIISRKKPENPIVWGFQSGPILVEDSKAVILKIKDDRLARRSVIGVNNDGRVIFVYTGPVNLEELPKKIGTLGLVIAINLDGGSASAFYGEREVINESSAVGSWLCVKK